MIVYWMEEDAFEIHLWDWNDLVWDGLGWEIKDGIQQAGGPLEGAKFGGEDHVVMEVPVMSKWRCPESNWLWI